MLTRWVNSSADKDNPLVAISWKSQTAEQIEEKKECKAQ